MEERYLQKIRTTILDVLSKDDGVIVFKSPIKINKQLEDGEFNFEYERLDTDLEVKVSKRYLEALREYLKVEVDKESLIISVHAYQFIIVGKGCVTGYMPIGYDISDKIEIY